MPTNLPAEGLAIGQHSACLVRAALLNPDCSVLGGPCSGVVTPALATLTATPEYQDTTTFEPETACGDTFFTYERVGGLRRVNITAEFLVHDKELKFLFLGGTKLLGAAAGPFDGEVIGHAAPNYTDGQPASVYLEVIVENAACGIGECQEEGQPFPTHTGYVFGKGRYTLGDRTFAREVGNFSISGVATANPNLVGGPWQDWPAEGVIPNSPWIEIDYSAEQYEAILAESALCQAGCVDLPEVYS